MKKWIEDNLMVGGKLISKRCKYDWFDKTGYIDIYTNIIDMTSFLGNNSTFSERLYCVYNNITEIPICGHCKTNYVKFKGFWGGYYNHCSSKCASQSDVTKQRMIDSNKLKFGNSHYTQTEDFKNKAKNTWISKYGVDNPSKSDYLRSKKVDRCRINFGVDYPQQSAIVRKKSVDTNLKRYGVENTMQRNDIQNQVSKTKLLLEYDRFYTNPSFSEYIIPNFNIDDYVGIDTEYEFTCKRCNTSFVDILRGGKIPRCYSCYPNTNTSKPEIEIGDYIESLGFDIKRNYRVINGVSEVDIYIPEKQIAIEFNGLFYHSEISGNKNRNYHLNKTIAGRDNGIRLVHIFEDDWEMKKELIKKKLQHILGKNSISVYARKCEVVGMGGSEVVEFINNNHIQGFVAASVYIALKYNEDIVAVMTFSKRKIYGNTDWELVRYATSMNVVGGFSKLLNFFIKKYEVSYLISYALSDWTDIDNNVYLKNGFELSGKATSNYHYIVKNRRVSRIPYQKHKLKSKLQNFDENLTEWQNMQNNGYDRIWDCGSLKYIKKII